MSAPAEGNGPSCGAFVTVCANSIGLCLHLQKGMGQVVVHLLLFVPIALAYVCTCRREWAKLWCVCYCLFQ